MFKKLLHNPNVRTGLIGALLFGAIATAGGIKSWSTGDTLDASDVNGNFQHIHNAMVGGHGARLVNADVSASAAIGYTKLQNGRGISRAWAAVEATCSCGAPCSCTVAESLNVSGISKSATGTYTATLNYTATDADFAVFAHSSTSTALCWATSTSTTTVAINCLDYDAAIGPTATDAAFQFVVFDGD